ncbi:hypothetical protein GE115_10350 [Agromyces sp. CFH 90414]|uniref:Uncharacterized protein n=1 Tax=Agromyces agglutinans TaxID=2662258 RepID=A0A6I2F452_9MICO|nr:DUF6069 family protein [Agromyces agglutinans]MRG60265.1 hypothetical protein [Agromyces agglutinans]
MNETTTNHPSIDPTADDDRAPDASGARRRRLGRAATVAIAVVLPLLLWVVAVPVAGLELAVGSGAAAQTIGPAAIIGAALVAGLAAWGVLALLERFTGHGPRTFAIIGWTLLALSLLGPVTIGAAGPMLVVLLAMHVVTGAILVIGLPLAGRRRVDGTADERLP